MNKIILKGRLTADPELKTTNNGIENITISVAIDRYAGKDKEKITDFIPCKAWRQTAVFIDTYFNKGQEILIEGNMQIDKYEKDGENRTYSYVNVQNVEFCGSKSSNVSNAPVGQNDPLEILNKKVNSLDFTVEETPNLTDDDLPFKKGFKFSQ